ncbi:MAG TPA: ATP-binding protein [Bacteroidetes bacterium]|nr:ATP-binding protein [Bacteroidota bacterium]
MQIKRNFYQKVAGHLSAKEITVLTGARQVGKTTLLKELKRDLEKQGRPTAFFNLDIYSDKGYFKNQEVFLQKLKLELADRPAVVFIDEIQRKENAGLFLKGIYDRDLPYKFIVSGSGSLELKEKIQESLTGRKRLYEMQPVTFEEMVHYKTEYKYEGKLQRFFEVEKEKTSQYLTEYINYGGYPRIVTEQTAGEKKLLLEEIFRSYLERDITSLLSLSRPDAFILLIKILAGQICSPLNFSQLSSQSGISLPTLKKYLWYAEKTFVIKLLTPFFRNIKKELIRSPQPYFVDLGLRNYSLNLLGHIGETQGSGLVFENFIFKILQEKAVENNWTIKFWRTKDKAEVDFIIDKGQEIIPVEVKYRHMKQIKISRSFRSFLEKYKPPIAYLVNLTKEEEFQINGTTVKVVPFYRLFDRLG